MRTLLQKIIATTLVAAFVVAAGVSASTSYASNSSPGDKVFEGFKATTGPDACKNNAAGQNSCSLTDNIQIIVNVLLFVIGAVAVVMIIIGGIRYVTSDGDSSRITSAKNTILYSVIGLIIALLAFALVNFIINQFVN